jgi:hypothetical protein
MVAMDLTRFAAVLSVPAAYALGRLSFAQLLVVSVVVGAADIAFKAAGGACLKGLVPPADLLAANGRLESTTWTATALGPPLGGAAVNGLILATAPLLAVLMLGRLGFAPWQYGLAFGAPCVGGLVGSRLARPLVARFGQHPVLLTAGSLRACWSLGLAFVRPSVAGLVLVMTLQLGLVTCMGVFNPVFATYRLEQTATDRVARTLAAWSVSSSATIAALTALWGLLAGVTGPRTAIAIAGVLILATPLLLPRHDRAVHRVPSRTARA